MDQAKGTVPQSTRTLAMLALAAVVLQYAAQPPIDFGWAIWAAPLPWLWLAAQTAQPGKRGYLILWLSGFLFWLATMQGVRLAHPAQYLGWVVLSAYLGVYTPLVVGLTRVARHHLAWPLPVAASLVWMGLELIRSYAFTGLSIAMLGHAALQWPMLFQIADLGGTYLVSGVIVFVAGALVAAWQQQQVGGWKPAAAWLSGATLLLLAVVGYGKWRLEQASRLADGEPMLRIGTIQRDTPAVYEYDASRLRRSLENYFQGTVTLLREHPDLDLVMWPESMFTIDQPLVLDPLDDVVPPDAQMSRSEYRQWVRTKQQIFQTNVRYVQRETARLAEFGDPPAFLFGAGVMQSESGRMHSYNAALLYDADGAERGWYGKRHLVMFGEYLPFGELLPWLYEVLPMPEGTTPGPEPVVFQLDNTQIMPTICFETMVEQTTGDALRRLRMAGATPDLLVNVTNDGWFHGTAILDHHLDCSRAVAAINRRPMIVAANSGITAWIDSSGRVVRRLPKRVDGVMYAAPRRDSRDSLYQRVGDWPARVPAVLCVVLAGIGWRRRG